MSTENQDLFVRNDGNEIQRNTREAQDITLNGEAVDAYMKKMESLGHKKSDVGLALTTKLMELQAKMSGKNPNFGLIGIEIARINEDIRSGHEARIARVSRELGMRSLDRGEVLVATTPAQPETPNAVETKKTEPDTRNLAQRAFGGTAVGRTIQEGGRNWRGEK